MTENNLFEEITETTTTPVVEETDALETLVGEGKKFKDVQALAKGKIESDNFIQRLQAEQEELRKELEKRATYQDLLDQIAQNKDQASRHEQQAPVEPPIENGSPLDIDSIVSEKLSAYEKEKQKESNLNKSISTVRAAWGDNAQVQLNQKAKELGISLKQLEGYAQENPNVFLALVGVTPTAAQPKTVTPVQSSVDTSKNISTQSGVKNKAYYDKLRAENPKVYFAAATQVEMHNNALKLGESFFN